MPFKPVGPAPAETTPATPAAPAQPKARIRAASPATEAVVAGAEPPAADPANPPAGSATDVKPKPTGIQRAADRNKPAPGASATADTATAPVDNDDPLGWTHQGDEAAAIAEAETTRREEAREERRARGYWPIRFELIPPNTQSRSGPIMDRYQADVIILDARPGPSFWEHVLRNARTGRYDVIEPCPKEFDNCPLCPPNGERESGYVMLLTVLNLNGYTYKTGAKAGQHVPITKELMVPFTNDHAYFHQLAKDHDGLRGIQLTMTRGQKSDPRIGIPSFVGKFDDEQIEQFIRQQGMWQQKVTQEGEVLEGEDWMMHAFRYAEFLHRPSGADLRARYSGQNAPAGGIGGTPVGARTAGDPQWGGGRYAPGAAGGPGGQGGFQQGAPGGGMAMDDLEDDVPF